MPSRNNDRARGPKVASSMDPESIEILVVMILKNREIRDHARRLMRPEHFSKPDEGKYSLLIRVLFDMSERYDGEMVPYLDLRSEAIEEAGRFDVLDPREMDALFGVPDPTRPLRGKNMPGLLWWAYHKVKDKHLSLDYGLKQLRRFLRERGVDQRVRDLVASTAHGTVTTWAEEIEGIQRFDEQVHALSSSPFETLAWTASNEAAVVLRPSGLNFIDDIMDGGPAVGEIIGFLAGTNRGKSTLVGQWAFSHVRQFLVRPETADKASIIFTFEDQARMLQTRIWANACNIPRRTLERMTDPKRDLSHTGKLHDYEVQLAKDQGLDLSTAPGEYERFMAAQARFSKNLLIVDMNRDGRGDGGVSEIVGILKRVRDRGVVPGAVFVDSIDLMVERWVYTQSFGDPERAINTQTKKAVHDLRRNVGVQFELPVTVTNQLNGASLKKGATYAYGHSDAAASKLWAKGLDHHIVLGPPGLDNVSILRKDKARRGELEERGITIKLMGDFSRWVDMRNTYAVANSEIVKKEVSRVYAGPKTVDVPRKTQVDMIDDAI